MTRSRLHGTATPLPAGEELLAAAGFSDIAVLAEAADATVYRAVQPALARTVAVRLQHEPMRDAAARRRFAEQCAVLGRLGSHPNIVEVYGCDFGAQGRPYVVTELPTGQTLADRLRRAAWPWRDVLEMAVVLAGALETAHRAGVIHGHVRTDQVLVSAYGRPQLADFGTAADQARTQAHDVRGLAAVCAAALRDAGDVPDPLRELLDQALDGRFATATELATAVQQLQEQLGCSVTPLPLIPAADRGPASPRRWRVLAAVVVVGAAAVVAIALAAGRPPATEPLLEVQGLTGEWEPDAALGEQLRSAPDAYLCRAPDVADGWGDAAVAAYTTTTRGSRVGVALHDLSQPVAAALLDDVAGQACLQQLEGLTDVRVSTVDVGDEGVLLQYRRAAAEAPVEIAVVVARRGGLVGQAVHLGYPTVDPAVTAVLQQALDAALDRAAP